MKIAIVGSRPSNNIAEDLKVEMYVYAYVELLPKNTVIVSGGAKGVDSYAVTAAKHYGLPKPIIHLPDWNKHGKSAGMIRNQLIVDDADVIVAFWNEVSSGTANTIARARKAGKQVIIKSIKEM